MPRWGLSAVALGLAAVLAIPCCGAESDDAAASPPASGSWFSRWFTASKPAAPKKAPEKTMKDEDLEVHKMATRAAAAAERAQEEKALLRRQAVCLKLRTIAAQTNNEELRRQADELDDRAWAVYQRRIAHLPAGGAETPHVAARGEMP
jgi:hypothetical protein